MAQETTADMVQYEFYCTECDAMWQADISIHDYEEGKKQVKCLDCDPNKEKPTTLERFMGNCAPRITIEGGGVFRPGSF